jgi:CDP-6-deoxy-D-xylo-4-hexulose-3-dehydrase
MRRIFYGGSVHDDDERNAVLAVLDDPTGLRIGKHVAEMEAQVAALLGKRYGVMCNSGSSALYLAVELLDLPPGSEVITSPLTFSTDIAPLARAGLVPVFADVEVDTFQIDVTRIEEMVTDRTKAILVPNLAGNAPDWDAIRAVADRHALLVIEDSCDALGATLRGTPTGTRADISVTSFSLSHIITCAGDGGMVAVDDPDWRDRALLLRRWGRRSEVQLYGSRKGERDFWEDLDGIRYDSLFIFDELGWNFGPSELGAAFGVQQLKKLPVNHARRQANFAAYTDFFNQHPGVFVPPRQTAGLDTAWLSYLVTIDPAAGFSRSELQMFLEQRGIDTRTAWTGNAARQPMMKGVEYRQPADGLPNADRVMEYGMLLPCGHGLDDDDVAYVIAGIAAFLDERGE